jgi:hypothetical protein
MRDLIFWIPLALLICICLAMLLRNNQSPVVCWLRQQVRRLSWAYLFVLGLASYPYQLYLLLKYQVAGMPLQDQAGEAARFYAKLVDPVLFYSKVSISVGVFCLINLMAWGSLRVIPVLIDWATGYYREERADFPAHPGFKGTFLKELTGAQRMATYIAVWGLELVIGWGSVHAGFSIQ